ncbi:DUF2642 domain-containing protein [Peribacillus sp. NPDC097675]|uniref:DUF2642 domain-containing protein n=1 Tax=Peribacillus sp. NPDC097675 TaxID=3390618 RepID=UPI003D075E8F
MNDTSTLLGKQIDLQLSGDKWFTGILTDFGSDILVLFNGKQFLYFPMLHVHRFHLSIDIDSDILPPLGFYIAADNITISYRKALMNAKGVFSEIHVTGHNSLHGYITNVFNDYFTFYSPVYKFMYISLHHLKWLTPYTQNETPYTLSHEQLHMSPKTSPFYRTLADQLKKSEGKLVVFDGGMSPERIGLLKKVDNDFVEVVTAKGNRVFLKLSHVKTVYLP